MAGVVVTRDEGEDGELSRLLRDRGLDVVSWPAIRIAPPADPGPLERALDDMASYDWIVVTSRRAVAAVMERAGPPSPRLRVAAVGSATARSLAEAGWPVDLVPETQTGEALLAALVEGGVGAGTRVLFPASAIARDTLPDGLTEAGAVVVRVEAYRTEPAPLDRGDCRRAIEAGRVALVTFTSPSAVEGLEEGLGPELWAALKGIARAVAIGPTTGDAAGAAGFDVVVAEPHSLESLADRAAEAARALDRMEEE